MGTRCHHGMHRHTHELFLRNIRAEGLVLFCLRIHHMKSCVDGIQGCVEIRIPLMVKMQPEINRIKAKHFGDADRIADEQSQIFKREKYNPLASLIPLAVQIILLMGLVEVIYHPWIICCICLRM